jgi:hypothetical protein
MVLIYESTRRHMQKRVTGQIVSQINPADGRTNRNDVFILCSFHTLCANTIYQEMKARPNHSGSSARLSLSRNRETY